MNKKFKTNDFNYYLNQELKDPKFKKWYDYYGKQLEIAYAVLKLRKKHKMSQAELARKVGTTQSNVARMESGQQNFTVATLIKIEKSLEKKLEINFN